MRIKDKVARKQPSDYPQMIFRVSQEDKDKLQKLIDRLELLANRKLVEDGDKKIRKNDVIVDALFLGLKELEKRLSRKTDK